MSFFQGMLHPMTAAVDRVILSSGAAAVECEFSEFGSVEDGLHVLAIAGAALDDLGEVADLIVHRLPLVEFINFPVFSRCFILSSGSFLLMPGGAGAAVLVSVLVA